MKAEYNMNQGVYKREEIAEIFDFKIEETKKE